MHTVLQMGVCIGISVIALMLLCSEADAAPANQRSGGGGQLAQSYRGHTSHRITEEECDRYLKQFGYMGKHDPDANQRRHDLMNFQRMAGIPQTGVLDDATSEMMLMSRCGNKDEDDDSTGKKGYSARSSWDKHDITYNFKSVSDLGTNETHRIIRQAFDHWQNVTQLTFKQIADSQTADIEIIFQGGIHTAYSWDQGSFDGPRGVLAHAFLPVGDDVQWSGDAHFDGDENFTDKTSRGINLLQVAVHEFGHSLGLGHSNVTSAIMAPFYRGYRPNFDLDRDDIAGIQRIYGTNDRSNTPSQPVDPPTNAPTAAPRPAPNGGPCDDGRVDAIAALQDGSYTVYAFRGNEYMILNDYGIIDGYPQPLHEIAPEFDGVDAALVEPPISIIIFRGNMHYVLYLDSNNQITSSSGPYLTRSRFTGLPNSIDAIFTYRDNVTYAFKDDLYYRLGNKHSVDFGYPRPISDLGVHSDLISGIDAIMQYENGRTYIFKSGMYYRYQDQFSQAVGKYPRTVADVWFGC